MNKLKVCLIYCLFVISSVSAAVFTISHTVLYKNDSKTDKLIQSLNYTPFVVSGNQFIPSEITKDPTYTYITGSWIENYPEGQNRYATLFYSKGKKIAQYFLTNSNSQAFAIESVAPPSTQGRATSTSIPKVYIGGKVVIGANQESAKIWFFENEKAKQIDLNVPRLPSPNWSVYISDVKSLILSDEILYAGGAYYQGPAPVYDAGPYLWRIDSKNNSEIDGIIVDKYGQIESMVQVGNYLYLAGYGYDYDSFNGPYLQVWKYDMKNKKVVTKLIKSISQVYGLGSSEIIGITKDNKGNLYIALTSINNGNFIGVVNQDLSSYQLNKLDGVPSSIDCDNQYLYVSIDEVTRSALYYKYEMNNLAKPVAVVEVPAESNFQGAKDLYVDKITTSSILN